MALISFGYRVNMTTMAPPTELGAYIVAYDLDGILKQKDHLGVISLVGSGTSGSSGSSGTSGIDGIVGGQLFYFNESVTGYTASYKELGNSPVISSEEIVTKTLGPTESNVLMSSYISDSLGLSVIPGGVQRFSLHYLKGSSQSNISTYAVVQLANQNGDKYYDLGATQAIAYSNTQEIGWQNGNVVYINLDIISITTEILATDRIVISLYANNLDTTTQSVSFYTEGTNNYSYVQTSTAVVPGPQGATGHGVTSSFYLQGTNDYSYDTTSDIYRTGSLAIGTSGSSTSKLHVYATQSGAFHLEDGTQGDSYILTSDVNGVATWTASVPFLTDSYSVIRTLVDSSQLIPEKQYVINDYVHKYYIENTNTSDIKTYKTVTARISNFLVLDGDYEYNLTVGMTITIESLPIGYSGSLIVGETTTVTEAPSSYYFRFTNGMHSTSTSIGVVISFGLPRFTTLTSLIGATISDTNLKVVMKPGGILNTDVHDGTIYGDMSALENFAPPTESLLLRAKTSNTFYEEAESLTFKNDKVIYDINDSNVLNDNLEVISTRNGFISRRFNDVLDIDIDKDWRVQKYRRWLLPTEYRSNLLNLTLGTSSLNSNQDKYLYTSELLGTASSSYMYLGKSLETTDITLGASGSVLSYGITFSTNQINFKDYPIFKLNSSLEPVKISKVKIDNLTNSVFIGNTTNFNYDLFVEFTTLSSSTFQGNIVFFGNNITLSNVEVLSDINIKGTFISLSNVNFLSTISGGQVSYTNINNSIFGSMNFGVFLSGYGTLPANTQVRWFTIFVFNSTIQNSILGCGTSTLKLNHSTLNGITLFKYGGELDIKNTQVGNNTIPNTVQYKSLLVQNYFITDSRLLNKDILVKNNINNFIVKTDINGILYYDNIDIITGLPTKFYYNDSTKLYTSINSGSIFYIRGGTSSAYDTTSDIYRNGPLNIGSGTASPVLGVGGNFVTQSYRFVVSSLSGGTVSLVVDETGGVYNRSKGTTNTLFGLTSLYSNTNGINNTAIGFSTLFSNTTGSYNVGVGGTSLYYNINGQYNIAIGTQALYNNLSGNYNIALGRDTLVVNTTGTDNIGIGYNALFNCNNNYNIALGSNALYGVTTGGYNIGIGNNTSLASGSNINSIVIGASASGNGSNSVTLGNNNITKTILKGNIGIGLTDPIAKLDIDVNAINGYSTPSINLRNSSGPVVSIAGTTGNLVSVDASTFNFQFGPLTVNPATYEFTFAIFDVFYGNVDTGYVPKRNSVGDFSNSQIYESFLDNVGIGTIAPGSKLTVQGNISIRNSSGFDRTVLGIDGISSSPYITLMRESDATVTIRLDSNNDSYFTGGNLGIGTASPSTKLHVYGDQSGAFRLEDGTQAAGYILTSDANGVGSWTASANTRNYKVYSALITQISTSIPTVSILENTLGNIVWSRSSVGTYYGTLTGVFTSGKTFIQISNGTALVNVYLNYNSTNDVQIQTRNSSNVNIDGVLTTNSIEIRVYN